MTNFEKASTISLPISRRFFSLKATFCLLLESNPDTLCSNVKANFDLEMLRKTPRKVLFLAFDIW